MTETTDAQAAPSTGRLIRVLLIVLIGSLSLTAIVGILVLLLGGSIGILELRVLLTTLVLALFSLTGLAASVRFARGQVVVLGGLGLAISGLGLLLSLIVIWSDPEWEPVYRGMAVAMILAAAIAYASLFLLITPRVSMVTVAMYVTLAALAVVAGMLIALALSDFDFGQAFFRILGAVAILMVLGTLLAPLLNRVLR
jgi:hypothetical protein